MTKGEGRVIKEEWGSTEGGEGELEEQEREEGGRWQV